jgi:hypothetical protein
MFYYAESISIGIFIEYLFYIRIFILYLRNYLLSNKIYILYLRKIIYMLLLDKISFVFQVDIRSCSPIKVIFGPYVSF